MAGHQRTKDTGAAKRTATGKVRRVREHLPAEEIETTKRRKRFAGARALVNERLARTTDPLKQLDLARAYVLSAAAKYNHDKALLDAVDALLRAGDHILTTGQELTPSARSTRRSTTARHRKRRRDTTIVLREGHAAIRQKLGDARNVA